MEGLSSQMDIPAVCWSSLVHCWSIFIHSRPGLPQDRTISKGREFRLLPLNPQGGGNFHSTEASLTKGGI